LAKNSVVPEGRMGEMEPKAISRKVIEVAAGILADAQGRVLLMQRLPGKHLAGLWEFPGGKVEPGETIAQALVREIDEELGVEVLDSVPLITIPWHYPEKSVRLHALRVTAWKGEPRAREGHPLRWVAVHDMHAAEMPAADAPILAALRLPSYYIISEMRSKSFLELADPDSGQLPQNDRDPISSGTEMLWQLRMPGATPEEVRQAAEYAITMNPRLRASLLVNHDIGLARELGLGVHLRAAQLRELRERPLPNDAWIGASCHDAEELDLAARLGADFATLSPVNATVSHPEAAPLGWERFAQLVANARLPVYALGGVGPEDLQRARVTGAQGVAGIRAFL
jgi:8-oxo-dGTP diphosphatase